MYLLTYRRHAATRTEPFAFHAFALNRIGDLMRTGHTAFTLRTEDDDILLAFNERTSPRAAHAA